MSESLLKQASRVDWLKPSVLTLLAANSIPVLGVVYLGWEIFPLVLLFWIENIIVGVFNALKMLTAGVENPLAWLGKLFLVPFFCVHYGMFTLVHGVFVIGFFGGGFRQGASFPDEAIVIDLVSEHQLGWAVAAIAISHGVSFLHNYLWGGEYRKASLQMLMHQPYGRVVVLHLTILGGAFVMAALRSPMAGLVVLIALKTALDLRGHLKERDKFQPPQRVREAGLGAAAAQA